jgi:integrator complex subunit 1
MHALCSLLRRDTSHNFKSKGNPLVPVLAANLLLRGFQDKKTWPDVFVKVKLRLKYVAIRIGKVMFYQ